MKNKIIVRIEQPLPVIVPIIGQDILITNPYGFGLNIRIIELCSEYSFKVTRVSTVSVGIQVLGNLWWIPHGRYVISKITPRWQD